MKRIAVVCPDDLSIVLFCKGIIDVLKNQDDSKVYVLSDIWDEAGDGHYAEIIKSWGVEHIRLEMYRYINVLKDFKLLFLLMKLFRQKHIDIVVNITTKPNILGTIAGKITGVKQILCSVWGRGSVFVDLPGISNHLRRMFVLMLYRVAFLLATKVWFTNVNDLDYFLSKGIIKKKKTILTRNYVNTDEYVPYELSQESAKNLRSELGLEERDKVVIMVARMIWAKGIREFAEASKLLLSSLPHVKFILVGPGEEGIDDAIPVSYLRDCEKSGNFSWIGFRRDVKDLYALADVAVLPSYYKEGGYPRALTEPMAMAKPVIAADSVDCRGPVEDGRNGYLVAVKDSGSLARAIEILMKDERKRKEFGEYGRKKAEVEFDEKVIVRQVVREFLDGTKREVSNG